MYASLYVAIYIFWWDIFFNNSFYILFTWFINQFLLLNNFSFFYETFLLISLISLFWSLNFLSSSGITFLWVSGCFLCFFGYCECWLQWIRFPCVTRVPSDNKRNNLYSQTCIRRPLLVQTKSVRLGRWLSYKAPL